MSADAAPAAGTGPVIAQGVDEEPMAPNQRDPGARIGMLIAVLCAAYTIFHLTVMVLYPLETWAYRMFHVCGGLVIGFLTYSALTQDKTAQDGATRHGPLELALLAVAALGIGYGFVIVAYAWLSWWLAGVAMPPAFGFRTYGLPLAGGTAAAIIAGWLFSSRDRGRIYPADLLLCFASVAVLGYILFVVGGLRMRAGTAMAQPGDLWAAVTGVMLILELTRRLTGLALVIIVGVFIAYSFLGPWLPGFLNHRGYTATRFFTYIFTDQGVLGDPIAVSSTYIILFIVFAAFLQASRVGDYFVNFAFACAGQARGGPAKVAVFASGLMGMINGTSAGNVVSTGSLTIPLMKRVGYSPKSSAAIEATASSGGQILPPIMGAGAFIMAEVTGIPYTDIVVAAIIPALLYFVSVYFMVDLQALKLNMKGLPRSELPRFDVLVKQIYLFLPIIILIYTLFAGYSVIRAGAMGMAAAAMVSWLTPHKMGPRQIFRALELGARMSIQMVAVCAAAGVIVGVIALTGVGARFSTLLLTIADQNQYLAMFFAMCISIVLGMGMPTTAAYAVAAAVVAPGLISLGVPVLVAHFFVFYYAVMSAITPPVALAAYAGAALSGSDPMKTSVEAFRLGLAAFIVPFMFFSSHELLMQGEALDIIHATVSALLGMFLLSAGVIGYFFGPVAMVLRIVLIGAAMSMISVGWITDLVGLSVALILFLWQRKTVTPASLAKGRAD
ncbi:TRAP transporter, 4TM/12TM fusion protein [Gemmobacter megaterium]|uniref:TRAP transporter, 4TM/12TM fusion protein n=1 Tax=Gemmobacter megaterium TaxID=1086013 RepID=A0A1N7N8D4_9RHOB|nr:TRAP transporter permease [Gemmobacter megaterium]SIS94518.1 TRAP transporter, 4TM/12TM fusion protein [Gemmobacter megaterium]